jgi:hypothetical protein
MMETHVKSIEMLLLKDFGITRQKPKSWDVANLTRGICGICPICDPLHCILVELIN